MSEFDYAGANNPVDAGGGSGSPLPPAQGLPPVPVQDPRLAAVLARLQPPAPEPPWKQALRKLAPLIGGAFAMSQGGGGAFAQSWQQGAMQRQQMENSQAQEDLRLATILHQQQQEKQAADLAAYKERALTAANAKAEAAAQAKEKALTDKARASTWAQAWKDFQQGGGIDRINEMVDQDPEKAAQYVASTNLPALVEAGQATPTLKELMDKHAILAPDGKHYIGGKDPEKPDPELAAYAQALGKTVSQLTFADRLAYHKKIAEAKKVADDDAAVNLTGPALDMAAMNFLKSGGNLPPMGLGKKAADARIKIINRAADMFPSLDLATQKALHAANTKSLGDLTVRNDALNAFERTGKKNLALFLSKAANVVDSGSPWINQPLRSVSERGMGDKDMAAYNAARQVATVEIGRVLNNPNMTGVLSDSARSEIAHLIPADATFEQIVEAAKILNQDMDNRRAEYDTQLGFIRGRIMNFGGQPAAVPPALGGGAPAAQGTDDAYTAYLARTKK